MLESANIRSILPRRYFTLDEANQALSAIRAQFEIAVIYNRRLDKAVSKMGDRSQFEEAKRRAVQIRDELDRVLEVVRREGVEIANLSPGTLDFPAMRNGKQVYISWRMGDKNLGWWRPIKARQSAHRKLVPSDQICWEWRN